MVILTKAIAEKCASLTIFIYFFLGDLRAVVLVPSMVLLIVLHTYGLTCLCYIQAWSGTAVLPPFSCML